MFPNAIKTGLTLPKILTGINKTLTVANQIIPIYVQAKPMIQNMKGAWKVAKEFLNQTKNTPVSSPKEKERISSSVFNQSPKSNSSYSNPVFFLK